MIRGLLVFLAFLVLMALGGGAVFVGFALVIGVNYVVATDAFRGGDPLKGVREHIYDALWASAYLFGSYVLVAWAAKIGDSFVWLGVFCVLVLAGRQMRRQIKDAKYSGCYLGKPTMLKIHKAFDWWESSTGAKAR